MHVMPGSCHGCYTTMCSVPEDLAMALIHLRAGILHDISCTPCVRFLQGVASAAGRPRVPPSSAVVFDVQLVYVPGALSAKTRIQMAPSRNGSVATFW